tara:strand:+ start:1876 stop:2301 length:426 start_codon:yes stop_codon:yes gene_type:complete
MAKKVNLDVSEKLDITCRRGDTFSLTLTLKDSDGNLIQLSTLDYEFLMDVKTPKGSSVSGSRDVIASSALSKSQSKVSDKLSSGFNFTDITDSGTVKLTASSDVMSDFPVGIFRYDIQQKVGEEVTTILRGSFKVNEDISN